MTHSPNVALPLHAVCTKVQVNFRNGTDTPLPSPTSSCNVTKYQTWTNIVNNSSSYMMVQDPPRGRMKILTGIQKQNNRLNLVFCEGERWERGLCFDRSCSNHAGIHRVNNVGEKSSCCGFRCSCEHSLDVFRQKAKANFQQR